MKRIITAYLILIALLLTGCHLKKVEEKKLQISAVDADTEKTVEAKSQPVMTLKFNGNSLISLKFTIIMKKNGPVEVTNCYFVDEQRMVVSESYKPNADAFYPEISEIFISDNTLLNYICDIKGSPKSTIKFSVDSITNSSDKKIKIIEKHPLAGPLLKF